MNNPAHLRQPLRVIHSRFQNKRDSSRGKDLLHFPMYTLHSHFQLIHLNVPKHSHIYMASDVNLAYCDDFSLSFCLSLFSLISLYKLHFHNISGMVSAHLSQVGSWKYTRLSNLPNATQEVNGRARDKLQLSQSSFLVSYKTIPSLPQKQTAYEIGISTNSIYFRAFRHITRLRLWRKARGKQPYIHC